MRPRIWREIAAQDGKQPSAAIAHGCGPQFLGELAVRFPGGGNLSIEFVDDAPDADQPRPGTWLELRANDPAALMRTVLDAGHPQVNHPGHPYYFMAPGGQVFTIVPAA